MAFGMDMARASAHPEIAYLVHDLNDAAVARRVRAFERGGATTTVAGFHRREAVEQVAGAPAASIGRTQDAKLAKRAASVARHLVTRDPRLPFGGADVIVARNLEMLGIAARWKRPGQRLVYECLDIHRLMLGDGPASRAIRALERRLLAAVDLLVVSSPAFHHAYFRDRQHYDGPVMLVENKVMEAPDACPRVRAAMSGRPWRIGWFGMLRCRRSLRILEELVVNASGRIEVLIAGRPSRNEFEDFEASVAQIDGIEFAGPYRPDQLADLYGAVDFSWCIDFFEEGLNSAWLLPNRLYESIAHGTVPIALEQVETGRWLAARDIGIRLDRVENLAATLGSLSTVQFAAMQESVCDLDRSDVAFDDADHRELVRQVAGA